MFAELFCLGLQLLCIALSGVWYNSGGEEWTTQGLLGVDSTTVPKQLLKQLKAFFEFEKAI